MKRSALTPQQEAALRDVIFRVRQPGYGPQKPTRIDHELDAILQKIRLEDLRSGGVYGVAAEPNDDDVEETS